jgi:hypothetical protein
MVASNGARGVEVSVKALFWIGLVMVVCWGVLWLGIKLAVTAVHALLLLGLVLIAWGFLHSRSASRGPR